MMGAYERHCEEFALFGDPERDHWDHEEGARYDRWDGYRMDMEGMADPVEPVTPEEAWYGVLCEEEMLESKRDDSWANAFDSAPF